MNVTEVVEREMEEYQRNQSRPWYKYFNNFRGNLPFGWRRSNDASISESRCTDEKASERLRNRTYAEFYLEIDRTITELRLDLDELRRLQEGRDLEKLYTFTLPLYIRLREKGYNHHPDLSA